MYNSMVQIFVDCQYYENKAFWEGGECWRAKGGVEFVLSVDSDMAFYAEECGLMDAVRQVIAAKCDGLNRYEYIGHRVQLDKPEDITHEVMNLIDFSVKVGA